MEPLGRKLGCSPAQDGDGRTGKADERSNNMARLQ